MVVREPSWSDFEGLFALRTNRYDEIGKDPSYGMGTNPSRPTLGEFAVWFADLHRSLLEGTGVCSVAEVNGKIVGMAGIRRQGEALETKHVGVLSIEVLQGFRGNGIGSALLEDALKKCRGRFEVVQLEVLPGNVVGQRLYQKFGFEVHGRLPRAFYRAGVYHDFILMHRVITPASETPARL